VRGAEVTFSDRRKRARKNFRKLPSLPDACWRCKREPSVKGHASCRDCLAVITERAREIKEERKRGEAGRSK
jgi:hypothetical protein